MRLLIFTILVLIPIQDSLPANEGKVVLTNLNPKNSQAFRSARAVSTYDAYILNSSAKYNLDPELVKAVIKQESNFNPGDISKKGAEGLMQLMPETARLLGVENSFDPKANIEGGARYLRCMLEHFNGDLAKALAAYNAGPAPVKKYGDIPPYYETRNYVKNVLQYYKAYQGKKIKVFQNKSGALVFTDQPYTP